MKSKQLNALTATRGFAALLVVIFHFGLERFPMVKVQIFFSKGNLAVSYFYVLSGFIMCWTYRQQDTSYGNYILRRIGRIVPLYLFALLAYISFFVWRNMEHLPLDANFIPASIMSVFFLQSYIPSYALVANPPGWSLSVEMLFYLTFPFFLRFYKRDIKKFTIMASVVFAASQSIHLYFAMHKGTLNDNWLNFAYYNPIFHINEFLVGMVGCFVFTALERSHKWQSPVLLFLLMVFAATYAPPVLHNGLMAPLVVAFVIAVAVKEPSFLNVKPLIYLGEISYGIYILQFPVYLYWEKLNNKVLHVNADAAFYVFVVLLIIVSALSYEFIEHPLRKRINALSKK